MLNKRLADREFLAGNYSIADMASYLWVVPHTRQGQNLDDFPHLKRWFKTIRARPATARAYALRQEVNTQPTVTEEAKRVLFEVLRGSDLVMLSPRVALPEGHIDMYWGAASASEPTTSWLRSRLSGIGQQIRLTDK